LFISSKQKKRINDPLVNKKEQLYRKSMLLFSVSLSPYTKKRENRHCPLLVTHVHRSIFKNEMNDYYLYRFLYSDRLINNDDDHHSDMKLLYLIPCLLMIILEKKVSFFCKIYSLLHLRCGCIINCACLYLITTSRYVYSFDVSKCYSNRL
jgi:hypothetical protein